jgi:hypothetical protein
MRRLSVWMAAAVTVMLAAPPPTVAATSLAPPTITDAKLLTRSVNVAAAPATPAMSINYSAPAGVSSITVSFISESGQTYEEYVYFYAPTAKSGTLVIQDVAHPMSLYSEPGVWAVENIAITDFANNSAGYSGTSLIFILPNPTFTVVNAGKSYIVPPSVTAGSLTTTQVSVSSSSPYFAAQLTVADTGAGVDAVYVGLKAPKGPTKISAVSFPSAPILKGTTVVGADMSSYGALLGTWIITDYEACDAASNCLLVNNASDIAKLFGRRAIELVK